MKDETKPNTAEETLTNIHLGKTEPWEELYYTEREVLEAMKEYARSVAQQVKVACDTIQIEDVDIEQFIK